MHIVAGVAEHVLAAAALAFGSHRKLNATAPMATAKAKKMGRKDRFRRERVIGK